MGFLKYLLVSTCLLLNIFNRLAPTHAVFTTQKLVKPAQLIVPGKSIGQTKLNENAKIVFEKLGKPDNDDAAMGKSLSTWYAHHNPSGYQTQIFCSRYSGNPDETVTHVIQIRVTSPYFKTANSIGVGSTLKQINASLR